MSSSHTSISAGVDIVTCMQCAQLAVLRAEIKVLIFSASDHHLVIHITINTVGGQNHRILNCQYIHFCLILPSSILVGRPFKEKQGIWLAVDSCLKQLQMFSTSWNIVKSNALDFRAAHQRVGLVSTMSCAAAARRGKQRKFESWQELWNIAAGTSWPTSLWWSGWRWPTYVAEPVHRFQVLTWLYQNIFP